MRFMSNYSLKNISDSNLVAVTLASVLSVYSCRLHAQQVNFEPIDEAESADFNMEFDEPESQQSDTTWQDVQNAKSAWDNYLFDPLRVSLTYELSYKYKEPEKLINNRPSVRVEYSKFFWERFYILLDTKSNLFLADDHRNEAGDKWENITAQAYLQTSMKGTSIRMGYQSIAWGDSEISVVTDEVSPRNNQELFNFNLEDLRIGQPMISLNQYTGFGTFNVFYTPEAKFNKYPVEGSAYYFDPFNGAYDVIPDPNDKRSDELGLSWKKTLGNTDLTLLAASLIDNNYAYESTDPGIVMERRHRFDMAGLTFVSAVKRFLLRGEVAVKKPLAFTTQQLGLIERDSIEATLGFDYSASATFTLSFEGVNKHILDWDDTIVIPESRQTLYFGMRKLLLHDDLSFTWRNIYESPNESYLAMLLTSYKIDDDLSVEFNVSVPTSQDPKSDLWIYRDQKQVAFKIRYQF